MGASKCNEASPTNQFLVLHLRHCHKYGAADPKRDPESEPKSPEFEWMSLESYRTGSNFGWTDSEHEDEVNQHDQRIDMLRNDFDALAQKKHQDSKQ